jgi:hypothetical protein
MPWHKEADLWKHRSSSMQPTPTGSTHDFESSTLAPTDPEHFRPATAEEVAMELSERNPALRDHLLEVAQEWCKGYFHQESASVAEMGEIPTAYPDTIFGYRVVIEMSDYPQRELVDILVAADSAIVGVRHIIL